MLRDTHRGSLRGILALGLMFSLAACTSSYHPLLDAGPDSASDAGVDAPTRDSGGGIPEWARCRTSLDCVVAPASCCGSCGAATEEDMVGVNRSSLLAQREEACGDDAACPACFMEPDPHLVATCEDSICVPQSLRFSDALADCESDDDCILRTSTCCPTCGDVGSSEVIAVPRAQRAGLYDIFCGEEDVACDDCESTFPPQMRAVCQFDARPGEEAERRYCRVAWETESSG